MKRLKKIKDQNAFKIPLNYFEEFETRIIDQQKSEIGQKESWLDRLAYDLQLRFTIPSLMVVGLFSIVWYLGIADKKLDPPLSDEEIQSYLMENFDEELKDEIYAMTNEIEGQVLFSDEEIMNYLSEENIDLELINEYINPN